MRVRLHGMTTSPQETAARAAKAARLADAFWHEASQVIGMADVCAARRAKVTPAGLVATMAREASVDVWVDLAANHGIRKPSASTIEATCLLLEARARTNQPADPFEGLPG